MTISPEGQSHHNHWSFLNAWEKWNGKLSESQRGRFLEDSRIWEIISFSRTSVNDSLSKFMRFDEILEDLRYKASTNHELSDISPEDLGMAEIKVETVNESSEPSFDELLEFLDPELLEPEPWEQEPKRK